MTYNNLAKISCARPVDQLDAVFFDFDGVLVDSLHIKANAFVSLFDAESNEVQAKIKAHFYEFTGRSRQEKLAFVFQKILARNTSLGEIERLAAEFQSRSLTEVIACDEISGALHLLKSLSAELRLFVVSGTPENELLQILRARKIEQYFEEVRGTPTPKEVNIAELLQRHRLTADRCIMIGDGKVDYHAAKINTMPFIGVVPPGKVSPFSADCRIITDMHELKRNLFDRT